MMIAFELSKGKEYTSVFISKYFYLPVCIEENQNRPPTRCFHPVFQSPVGLDDEFSNNSYRYLNSLKSKMKQ